MTREELERVDLDLSGGPAALVLHREDLSAVFPGMLRYLVLLETGDRRIVLFSTNTYEYTPLLPIDAEQAGRRAVATWAEALRADPERCARAAREAAPPCPTAEGGVLVLQGSPRPDGSCALLAEWAAGAAAFAGLPAEVVFVHDLAVAPCIGCYQCYNTGLCTFDDDMSRLGPAIRDAALLVVCSPVYTNTVPAGLKAVIDRAQALHAETSLLARPAPDRGRAGVLLATAGRPGGANFTCVRSVVRAFMANLGIRYAGEVLVDDLDARRDPREVLGLEERVRSTVLSALAHPAGGRRRLPGH
ncbi:MAG: flavodoxin family protein [Methanospirillum sp.]|nr:flavodoxin family protein [Methanospirillum sp.]